MAKNTHAQEAATGTSDSYTHEEWQDVLSQRPTLGNVDDREGDEESVGNSFTPSSESESTQSDSQNPDPLQPAQTTENPSNQRVEESSIAPSTDGSTQETQQAPSGRPRKAAKATRGRPVLRTTNDDDDDF